MKLKYRAVVVTLSAIFFATGYVVIDRLVSAYVNEQMAEEREFVRQGVALAKSTLEAQLFRDIYLADSLATVVNISPSFAQRNWQRIAAKLIKKSDHIRNVGMAPDNVIQYIYPLSGNEKALGVDFRDLPEQLKTVNIARRTKDVHLAGPLELVQGGQGLIARYPVFTDYPISLEYWGTVSVVLNYDSIIKATGMETLTGAQIALRGFNGAGGEGAVFWGDATVFQEPDILLPINIPNGEWLMAVNYQLSMTPTQQRTVRIIWSVGSGFTLLLFLAVLLIYRSFRLARRVSLQDELTSLPNRRFVMSYLESLFKHKKAAQRFTLVNIDLNHFKWVNDSFGHEVGDALLKHVATCLQSQLRHSDVVARVGGDEFLLVLNRLNQAEKVERVLTELVDTVTSQPLLWQQQEIYPSLSIGYAIAGQPHNDLASLLSAADAAMYENKQAARRTATTVSGR